MGRGRNPSQYKDNDRQGSYSGWGSWWKSENKAFSSPPGRSRSAPGGMFSSTVQAMQDKLDKAEKKRQKKKQTKLVTKTVESALTKVLTGKDSGGGVMSPLGKKRSKDSSDSSDTGSSDSSGSEDTPKTITGGLLGLVMGSSKAAKKKKRRKEKAKEKEKEKDKDTNDKDKKKFEEFQNSILDNVGKIVSDAQAKVRSLTPRKNTHSGAASPRSSLASVPTPGRNQVPVKKEPKDTELPKEVLKAMSLSLGFKKEKVTGHMTPAEAAAKFSGEIGVPKLRAALQVRGIANTGGHMKKVQKMFEYDLKALEE